MRLIIFANAMNDYPILTLARKKSLQRLLVKKYREEDGKFLIEGPHLLQEALRSSWTVEEILISPFFRSNPHASAILQNARSRKIKVTQCPETVIKRISDTVTSQGILAVVIESRLSIEELWRQKDRESLVVALDGITDPGNLGTIIRSCDWFGVNAVLIGRGTVDLYNPKSIRSTMGSLFHIPVFIDVDLTMEIPTAKKSGFTLLATTSSGGTLLGKKISSKKSVVIFGNEARGINRSLLGMVDYRMTIPRFGDAESLNVGISCGIILSWFRLSNAPVT